MPLSDYQKQIDDVLQAHKTPYWSPLSQVAHLVEDTGEVALIYNHK